MFSGFTEFLFGWGLPVLLLGVGICYLVSLRAFPYVHPVRTLRLAFRGRVRSSLRALSVALGGTLGVGNITGVALALAMGGAGAVFWMWVSAAVAMFLKDQIGFYDIYDRVSRAVEEVPFIQNPSLDEILEADRLARLAVRGGN